MKKVQFYICLLLIQICLLSCQAIMKSAMGVKEMKHRTTKEIVHYSKKNKIPNELSYSIDTNLFCSSIATYKEKINDENALQDIVQPLQIRMFENGELVFFHANCYTEGISKLDWNKFNSFVVFPPSDSFHVVVSGNKHNSIFSSIRNFQERNKKSVLTLNSSTATISPLFQQNIALKNEYVIMVYWSIFLNKQSKKLIKLIKSYAYQHTDKNITLVFVNIDNIYSLSCLNNNSKKR